MNDVPLVSVGQSIGDLRSVANDLLSRKPVRRNDRVQRASRNVLHGYEGDAVFFVDFVNRANVRVVQLRCGSRFVEQPTTSWNVISIADRQNFYSNVTVEAFVAGAVDFAHAASADLLQQTIMAQTLDRHPGGTSLRDILGHRHSSVNAGSARRADATQLAPDQSRHRRCVK